jgi:hypothetical protein
MKKISHYLLLGVLALVLLTACAGQEGSPTAVGTTIPGNETSYPPPAETASPEATLDMTPTVNVSATAPAATETTGTAATPTPGIPVTGTDLILLECQFCIEGMAHTMLVLPDTAIFETVADTASLSTPGPDMGCNTVDTFNGRQIVICRAEENTSLNLNVCTDGNNCTQLLVELQTCPDTNQPGVTNTPGAGVPTDTPGVGATDTPGVLPTNSPNAGSAP